MKQSLIVFPAGEVESSTCIETITDEILEEEEMFGAVFSNPSDGLTIGTQNRATIEIVDSKGSALHLSPTA